MNSNRKGKQGERQAAAALRDALGIHAKRGQQYSGSAESPDVVSDLDGIHIEVKRTERLRLYEAMRQADEDAGEDLYPVVLHRSNRRPWVVICYLSDLKAISKEISGIE